jgi:hypothetical protein
MKQAIKQSTLLLFVLTSVATAKAQNQATTINWTDATRDVFSSGQLDRTIQVFSADSPSRMALTGPNLDHVIVLDLDAKTVGTIPKSALTIATDRTTATSDENSIPDVIGMLTAVDDTTYSFDLNGKSFLLMRHKGLVGDLTEDKVWADVPIWQTLMGKYKPDADSVAALKKNKSDTTVIIAAGTWCGDSKHYVPQLLRALHDAGNKHIHVKLIGIANKFVEPADFIKQREIKKVPTIIVERKGHEIGRITETPVAPTMEADLVAILNGKPNVRKAQ